MQKLSVITKAVKVGTSDQTCLVKYKSSLFILSVKFHSTKASFNSFISN